ncbi:hypothetical protein NHX12_005210 [Muraenolepis orangiensis]|uniref:Uncharacterized protein n=1 Tax=Muraenolepis orangiensis TaxID=630683 RepID=A0A9Q0IA70_9TELE|nr:hypothetical protein NHX12_005210 [Muraenolepis orangiensis]
MVISKINEVLRRMDGSSKCGQLSSGSSSVPPIALGKCREQAEQHGKPVIWRCPCLRPSSKAPNRRKTACRRTGVKPTSQQISMQGGPVGSAKASPTPQVHPPGHSEAHCDTPTIIVWSSGPFKMSRLSYMLAAFASGPACTRSALPWGRALGPVGGLWTRLCGRALDKALLAGQALAVIGTVHFLHRCCFVDPKDFNIDQQ